VRELKNLIERAVLITSRSYLEEEDFHEEGSGPVYRDLQEVSVSSEVFSLREMEKSMIHKALERTNGNRTHAAEMLGISIRTLRNKLHEYKEGLSLNETMEAVL